MTAVTGANLRGGDAYWELSGPSPINRTVTCRACKKTIMGGESVMVRDGRKLRFHYHTSCFSGDADPRTQQNSSFKERPDYHEKTAPKLSSLEGPRACRDARPGAQPDHLQGQGAGDGGDWEVEWTARHQRARLPPARPHARPADRF